MPTISYRKNRIGINTQRLDDETDSVLFIQRAAGGGKHITFATSTDSGEQGRVILSLEDGSVIGMIIDCGSW